MSTRIRLVLVTDEGVYHGRRVREKLEGRCGHYGFLIPAKEKGVVEWKRLKSMFDLFGASRNWKMWVFRETRGVQKGKYWSACRHYGVRGRRPTRDLGGITPTPYQIAHPPRSSMGGRLVAESSFISSTAAQRRWTWGERASVMGSIGDTPITPPQEEHPAETAYQTQMAAMQAMMRQQEAEEREILDREERVGFGRTDISLNEVIG